MPDEICFEASLDEVSEQILQGYIERAKARGRIKNFSVEHIPKTVSQFKICGDAESLRAVREGFYPHVSQLKNQTVRNLETFFNSLRITVDRL